MDVSLRFSRIPRGGKDPRTFVRMALSNITNKTDGFWGTEFATAAEGIDPIFVTNSRHLQPHANTSRLISTMKPGILLPNL